MSTERETEAERRWELVARQMGERYAGCRFENFTLSTNPEFAGRQKTILAELQRATNPLARGQGILFFGPAGSGKDHLMTAALHNAVMRGAKVRWVNGCKLLTQLRSVAFDQHGAEQEILDRYAEPDILAISDPIPPIGDITPFQSAFLLQLVDQRYRNRRATWLTMNVPSRSEADARVGTQLLDRLTDGALVLACNWSSYRQPAAVITSQRDAR